MFSFDEIISFLNLVLHLIDIVVKLIFSMKTLNGWQVRLCLIWN